MGYYTNFTLSLEADFDIVEKYPVLEYADAVISKETGGYNWDGDHNELTLSEAKWYDWADEMKRISEKFPEVLFVLEGEGEESGDIWKAYFKAGKSQHLEPTITWPEFDESAMT